MNCVSLTFWNFEGILIGCRVEWKLEFKKKRKKERKRENKPFGFPWFQEKIIVSLKSLKHINMTIILWPLNVTGSTWCAQLELEHTPLIETLMTGVLGMNLASNICELKVLILAISLLLLNKLTASRMLLLLMLKYGIWSCNVLELSPPDFKSAQVKTLQLGNQSQLLHEAQHLSWIEMIVNDWREVSVKYRKEHEWQRKERPLMKESS